MTDSPILRETDGHALAPPTREPTVQQLARRYARAVGCADAAISTGLAFCKYPGSDLTTFVAEMRRLLIETQGEIEALVDGKGEEAVPVTERHGLRVVGSLASVTGGEHG